MQSLLAQTANPEAPNEVNVSQPSDALTARAAAAGSFDSLFLGLGAVALIVGAVGVDGSRPATCEIAEPATKSHARAQQRQAPHGRDPQPALVGMEPRISDVTAASMSASAAGAVTMAS
jgi:hypothetical protein